MIYIASDHIGVELKEVIVEYLSKMGEQVEDLRLSTADRVSYTDFAQVLRSKVLGDTSAQGILICGSGIGMSMMANRHKEIRAAVCT